MIRLKNSQIEVGHLMRKPDKSDPLDRMLVKLVQDIPVTFDDFLDVMAEAAKKPDCAKILQERGLCAQDVQKEAETYRADFLERLSERGLSVNDRFSLCAGLFSLAQKEPSLELRRIYCEILCDPGFLLEDTTCTFELDEFMRDLDGLLEELAVLTGEENDLDNPDPIILQYLTFCQDRDRLLETLARRKEFANKFSQATKKIRNPQPVDCDKERVYKAAECFAKIFELPEDGNSDILLGNLSNFIQLAQASPALQSIEPLFLFRLLTKHQSRMCTVPDLNVSLPSLWKRDKQQIERNNGRNFKKYAQNLSLFKGLCQIYQGSDAVDIPLCWYGLDEITVLGDFYREHNSPGREYAGQARDCPFMPVIEEVVEEAGFSCFQNCYEGNAVLSGSGITLEELDTFKNSNENSPVSKAWKKISDFMNTRATELAIQVTQLAPEEVKALCRDILERSEIKYRPASPHEVELFLAAINSGLMDLQDWLAGYVLSQAGHALLGEPTEIPEWLL